VTGAVSPAIDDGPGKAPLLDVGIRPAMWEMGTLTEAGVDHLVETYQDARHGVFLATFFVRTNPQEGCQ
jgi:hypothetical protein